MSSARSSRGAARLPEPVPIALARGLVDVADRLKAPLPVYAHLVELLADPTYGEPGTTASLSTSDPELEDRFWENAVREPSLRELAIEGPRAASDGAFGTVELAASTAATVGDALLTLGSFSEVLHGVSIFSVARRDDGSVAVLYESPHARERPAAELAAEFALASVVELARRNVGDAQVAPREVHLRGRPIARTTALAEALRCEVHVGAASDRLEIGADVAALPLRTSAPRLHEMALRLCRLERAALLGGRVATGVRWALRDVVTERVPLLDAVAAVLETRPRTMQARLTAEGVSFRALVDEARRATVEKLLVAGATPREIQSKLGYADAASLRRACRRWWGVGPTGRARALRVLSTKKP
jgi:AraC-like DNA-binding protein